jgi:hypothetical protein
MAIPRYILLKCVPDGARESTKATRKLELEEFRSLVQADCSTHWGESPRGALSVKNSDGTVAIMKASQGFSFTTTPGMDNFYICYEFYDGICVHTESEDRVCQKCAEFGAVLGASVFPIY